MTAIAMRTANWVGLPGLANWFKNLNKKLQARKQERETMYQLSKLNDRELHDLGISRSDIRSIARGTFHDDRVEANANLKGWV